MSKQQLETFAKYSAIGAAGLFGVGIVTGSRGKYDDWAKWAAIVAAALFGLSFVV